MQLKNTREFLFVDIPLLKQKGIVDNFDYLWIIESVQVKCCERIEKRNNYSKKKIEYLIENSKLNKDWLVSKYKIIDNNKSIDDLKILVKFELDNLKILLNLN